MTRIRLTFIFLILLNSIFGVLNYIQGSLWLSINTFAIGFVIGAWMAVEMINSSNKE